MAIAPSPKSSTQLLREFKDLISARTGINNFDSDSKTRAIVDAVQSELLEQRQEKLNSFYANQLAHASGRDLEEFGDLFNKPRRDINTASASAEELNLAYYVETGTFGDINSTNPIPLTKGTVIYSDVNENELGSRIDYVLSEDYTLGASETIGYVTASAVNAGAGSNVGRGVLRHHTFTDYTDSGNNTLKVINFFPILNGRDRESEEQYRYRLSRYYAELLQTNNIRIHLTALQVPGVLDTRIIPGYFGIGTSAVIVLGAESQATASLVNSVQARLNALHGPGLKAQAVGATEVALEIEMDVFPGKKISLAEQNRLTTQIRKGLLDYIRSIGIGGTLRLDEMLVNMQLRTQGVVKLGQRGADKRIFRKVYLRRGFANGALSEREELLQSSIVLLEDEYPSLYSLSVNYV